ncbi:IclR family transcriptional regulator C-terminal domain-containing protein [Devosia ginsengisoli]|uniref:IclR family transcriptional regulator domain-containing protein n=1 Tax=Devosia ginsengisoli TaxID=400770 RepID=UPI0026EDDFEA|nr:IclR family transcriptional regulator C-terminal domain-containing protein [Devosia ginsengisoli]MCR6671296.1 helix-turn-helix domain-containing protein [Devosia ginsengisoli]
MIGDDMNENAPPSKGKVFVEAFARGLRVIEAFGSDARRLSVAQVAKRADIDRAVARRLLYTLLELGYLKTDGKQFELTPLVLRLGFSFISSVDLGGRIQPYLDQLSQRVQESVSVTVLMGTEITYVARSDGAARPVNFVALTGSSLPVSATSSGRLLLSTLPDEEVEKVLREAPIVKYTPSTVLDRNELLKIVQQSRIDGWAVVEEELEIGLVSGSVLLRSRSGVDVAALNVSSHRSRSDRRRMVEDLIPQLRQTADSLQELLL